MTTIEVKNDYMLGRQNENILYYKCMELEQENKQLKQDLKDACYVIEKLKEDKKKAIDFIKHSQSYGTMAQVMPHLKPYVNGDDLLQILGGKENEMY